MLTLFLCQIVLNMIVNMSLFLQDFCGILPFHRFFPIHESNIIFCIFFTFVYHLALLSLGYRLRSAAHA